MVFLFVYLMNIFVIEKSYKKIKLKPGKKINENLFWNKYTILKICNINCILEKYLYKQKIKIAV